MANSHWSHTSGPMHSGRAPQAPQQPNSAWNPLAASLPGASYANSNYYASLQSAYHGEGPSISSQQQRSAPILNTQISSTYPHPYSTRQPPPPSRPFRQGPGGPYRCAHLGCPWSGPTSKTLEIHKMDRHLVFPPGWKPRKGPPDGEGGPQMPIPGTGITLNTPETIDAWIAERKKKWPSAARVEEKLKSRVEAIDRGELVPEDSRKRKRNDEGTNSQRQSYHGWGTTHHVARGSFSRGSFSRGSFSRGYGRPRGRGRGGGGGRGRGIITQSMSIPGPLIPGPALTPGSRSASPSSRPLVEHDSSSALDEESSNSDMDPIKDAISSKPLVLEDVKMVSCHDFGTTAEELDIQKPEVPQPLTQSRKTPRQPRIIQHPFSQRPPLLKQLLLPEVRHTVSNLSQAIRFLVDNEFLENVELKPGDADNPLIEEMEVEAVAGSARHTTSPSGSVL